MACGCSCGGNCETNLLYACSGAANTGLLADSVMRKLMADGVGSGTCLSGLGADISGFFLSARDATRNVVIDGCMVACGKKIFESKQLPFIHIVVTDFGVQKGVTPITDALVDEIAEQVREKAGL